MKFLHLCTCALLLLSTALEAQQLPDFAQYTWNYALINPGAIGTQDVLDLKVAARRQWAGVEGAPQTAYAWASIPTYKLNKDSQNEERPESYHSLGLQAYSDRAGIYGRNGFSLAYAYRLTLNQRVANDPSTRLYASAGFMFGILSLGIDPNRAILDNPNDPMILNAGTFFTPDASVGFWIYDDRFFAGASSFQILGQRVGFGETIQLDRQYYLTGGYRFAISPLFELMPSLLVKWQDDAPINWDINLMARYQNRLWLGASYRHSAATYLLAGWHINHFIELGYAYEVYSAAFSPISRGTHELILGFRWGGDKTTAHTQRPFFN
ncbi:MAG: type IX secretion system membrane protein PorP/SprF [Bernardetiaceae bacterium]|nr:type IX secretion system membrane protein PorP/SprF [Bernardetiaceae bacterium]